MWDWESSGRGSSSITVAVSSWIVLVPRWKWSEFPLQEHSSATWKQPQQTSGRPQHWPKPWKLLVPNVHRLSFCLIVCFRFVCFASAIISILGVYHWTAKSLKRQFEAMLSLSAGEASPWRSWPFGVCWEEMCKIKTASDSEWML